MKKTLAIALLAVSTGCGLLPATKGNGDVTTDNRSVSSFSTVVNNTSLKVTVDEGDAQAVSVILDSNLQSMVLATVASDTLLLATTGELAPSAGAVVHVTVPELKSASVTGSGDVEVGGLKSARALAFFNSSSGTLRFSGQLLATAATCVGSGPIILSGSATGLEAEVQGSGSLNAKDLVVTGIGKLTNSGSGTLTATINGSVSFDLSASGNIEWYGTAQTSDSKDTGSGAIIHH
jgi:Putative auto-transporter adhesin, head GIN domain